MANKKKTVNKKVNNKEVKNSKKQVNKTTNKVLSKEEIKVQNKKTIKEFIVIIIVIAIIFGVIYLLTVGASKLGWFDTHYNKPAIGEATISYENINLGTILDRNGQEYYVVLADMSNNSMHIQTIINNYKNKEGALPIYTVDLSDGLNKSALSEESNLIVENVSDLKVNDTSLIQVKSHKIVNAFVGTENIEEILK